MKTGYEEGPWVFKRNGIYYIVYAAGGVPEHMAYSTSSSINGPWKYQGRIMDEAKAASPYMAEASKSAAATSCFIMTGFFPTAEDSVARHRSRSLTGTATRFLSSRSPKRALQSLCATSIPIRRYRPPQWQKVTALRPTVTPKGQPLPHLHQQRRLA